MTQKGLDIPVRVTRFSNFAATHKFEQEGSLRELAPIIEGKRAESKAKLPWLKMASFGDTVTEANSYRHDANVLAISGVEADYDGGQITVDHARRVIEAANLAAIIYTSPSHTAANPRWRILCPTSQPLHPRERTRLLARVNGLFAGAFASESFALSQSYYYGAVNGAQDHQVVLVEGRPIDLATDLDQGAMGKPEPVQQEYVPAQPYAPPTDGEATAYGRKALDNVCNAIAGAPDGSKHHALNKGAYSIGGLVACGEIEEGYALAALRNALSAIRSRCENFGHAEKTLAGAFADGMASPRTKPDPMFNGGSVDEIMAGLYLAPSQVSATEPEPMMGVELSPLQKKLVPPEPPKTFPATPFDAAEITDLAPRQWVYGHFLIERFLSVLGAPGGTGKTAYAITVALAVALDQPFLGETVHKAGNVWIYNLEDPRDEILRRVYAACLQNKIDPRALHGKLYLDSGRDRQLVVAHRDKEGRVVALPVVEPLIEELKKRKIRLLTVDPFVKSHQLEENRNEQIDFAATLWNQVAERANCAIQLVHHFRKGAIPGEADAFRGASALIDAARSAVALSVMSEKEADRLGVDNDKRRFHIRADNAKLNLAPPPSEAVWLRLENVDLPNGDKVQAVARWEPPTPWGDMPMSLIVQVLDVIAAGRPNGDLWSPRKEAKDGWAGSVLVDKAAVTEGQAAEILRQWTDNKLLIVTDFENTKRMPRKGFTVDLTKIAEMRQQISRVGGLEDE